MKHIISLGAGVQSSTMALMAAKGELTPMPDCAIFADTGDEPQSVYRWLDWLEKQLPFPVQRVKKSGGTLSEQNNRVHLSKKSGAHYLKLYVPAHVGAGVSPRKCTYDFKIQIIIRRIREMAKPKRMDPTILVRQWIGISLDEVRRMKPARDRWIENVFPLIDKRVTRAGCLAWMKSNGYPMPPRSACVYCPYHNDREWASLKNDQPEEFAKAVRFEVEMQEAATKATGLNGVPFLHRSRVPLAEVRFADASPDLFTNECEGMCGV